MLTLTADEWNSPLIPLLAEEITKDEPGQEAVLDRLLDLLLIAVLRTWFACPEAQAPAWYRGYADPVVGRALHLLHHNPAHGWTVASLASATGVSRAAPDTTTTIAAAARQVGYGSPYALSSAFKRVQGVSPRQFRERAATG